VHDKLACLPIACLQPFELFIPDYTTPDGRRSGLGQRRFGVLSLYHETKVIKPQVGDFVTTPHAAHELFTQQQEPDYNFVLPHKNPLRCPVNALALLLHFVFDQSELTDTVEGWDWSRTSTWRKVSGASMPSRSQQLTPLSQTRLIFGRKIGTPSSGDTLRKMYELFLTTTTVSSSKKLHLARRTVPEVMEDMG
jgi:hypothetical protein